MPLNEGRGSKGHRPTLFSENVQYRKKFKQRKNNL